MKKRQFSTPRRIFQGQTMNDVSLTEISQPPMVLNQVKDNCERAKDEFGTGFEEMIRKDNEWEKGGKDSWRWEWQDERRSTRSDASISSLFPVKGEWIKDDIEHAREAFFITKQSSFTCAAMTLLSVRVESRRQGRRG